MRVPVDLDEPRHPTLLLIARRRRDAVAPAVGKAGTYFSCSSTRGNTCMAGLRNPCCAAAQSCAIEAAAPQRAAAFPELFPVTDTVCISPVDNSEYARRPVASDAQIEAVFARARWAQRDWARLPLAERARYCTALTEAMLAKREEIVPELAWQMGRPVKFGGGELRGFEERARAMIDLAEAALAPVVPPAKDGFKRYIRREPLGVVLTIAPWNYPYLTAVNSIVPALMAGN